MKYKFRNTTLATACILLASCQLSQQNNLSWEYPVMGEEILPCIRPWSQLFKDSQGKMWIHPDIDYTSTGDDPLPPPALCIYDGDRLTVIQSETSDLPEGVPTVLAEDQEGRVWVGVGSKHRANIGWADSAFIDRIVSIKAGQISPVFSVDMGAFDALGSIFHVTVDDEGRIWLAHGQDCARNPDCPHTLSMIDDGNVTSSFHPHENPDLQVYINDIIFDRDGRVWVCTRSGLSVFDGTSWSTYDPTSAGASYPGVWKAVFGDAGEVWVITPWDGIYLLIDGRWTSFPSLPEVNIGPLILDTDGLPWAGIRNEIYHFDGDGWHLIVDDPFDEEAYGSNIWWDLKIDSRGRLWAASMYGVASVDAESVTAYVPGNSPIIGVTDIEFDPRDRVWFANVGGPIVLNRE